MYDDCMILSMRFPQKLWRIINSCKTGAIRWNANGATILLEYKKFQEEYLDSGKSIFKTKNITSFIRQLNLYGFRKVTSHNRDPICNSQNPDVHEFAHDYFRAGRLDLLSKVCRKAAGKSKCYQRIESRDTNKHISPEKEPGQMSRLRTCQLALTEALDQISQEYHRKYWKETANDTFSTISRKTGLFRFDFHSIPKTNCTVKWIAENEKSYILTKNSDELIDYQ